MERGGGTTREEAPERRTCPTCGEQNPPEAGFCWRCASPLREKDEATEDAPADIAHEEPAGRGRRIVGAAVAIFALTLVVTAFFLSSLRSAARMPDSIDHHPKISSPAMDQLRRSLETSGFHATGAAYGTEGRLAFIVVVGDGRSGRSIDELFLDFLGGQGQPSGGTREEVEFRCSPVDDPFRAACMWRERDRLGIVVSVDRDVEATQELLFDARDAIG